MQAGPLGCMCPFASLHPPLSLPFPFSRVCRSSVAQSHPADPSRTLGVLDGVTQGCFPHLAVFYERCVLGDSRVINKNLSSGNTALTQNHASYAEL